MAAAFDTIATIGVAPVIAIPELIVGAGTIPDRARQCLEQRT